MTAGICLERKGYCEVIRVETDGNPAFVGATLYAKYQTTNKVERLIRLGDLYELHEHISPISNLGHYVLKENGKVIDIRVQEGVCISKYRDVRECENGVIKKKEKPKARKYRVANARLVYVCEGVDYLYYFKPDTEEWSTWCIDEKTGVLKAVEIHYMSLIKNLIYREDISKLTKKEKEKLQYIK